MIRHWRGKLGTSYAVRDDPRIEERRKVFERLGVTGYSVLEVGCNGGHNLAALIGLDFCQLSGIEPNSYARHIARTCHGLHVINGVCHKIPYKDRQFDLVLTAGVLIHIPPRRLDKSIRELIRVTRKTLLCLEYDGNECIPYRGIREGIWKRDYQHELLSRITGPVTMDVTPEPFLRDTPFEGCTAWKITKSS